MLTLRAELYREIALGCRHRTNPCFDTCEGGPSLRSVSHALHHQNPAVPIECASAC